MLRAMLETISAIKTVREARQPEGLEVRIADLTPLKSDGLSEAQHGMGLAVRGSRPAGSANFVIVQVQLSGEGVVGGEAIPGAIDLGHGQRQQLPLARRELALRQGTGKGSVGIERSRRVGEQVQEVAVGWEQRLAGSCPVKSHGDRSESCHKV